MYGAKVIGIWVVYISGDYAKGVTDIIASTNGEVVELEVVIGCDRGFPSERCTGFDRSLHWSELVEVELAEELTNITGLVKMDTTVADVDLHLQVFDAAMAKTRRKEACLMTAEKVLV
jgi:hypothetical protein